MGQQRVFCFPQKFTELCLFNFTRKDNDIFNIVYMSCICNFEVRVAPILTFSIPRRSKQTKHLGVFSRTYMGVRFH